MVVYKNRIATYRNDKILFVVFKKLLKYDCHLKMPQIVTFFIILIVINSDANKETIRFNFYSATQMIRWLLVIYFC